jgi:hypothetical protein
MALPPTSAGQSNEGTASISLLGRPGQVGNHLRRHPGLAQHSVHQSNFKPAALPTDRHLKYLPLPPLPEGYNPLSPSPAGAPVISGAQRQHDLAIGLLHTPQLALVLLARHPTRRPTQRARHNALPDSNPAFDPRRRLIKPASPPRNARLVLNSLQSQRQLPTGRTAPATSFPAAARQAPPLRNQQRSRGHGGHHTTHRTTGPMTHRRARQHHTGLTVHSPIPRGSNQRKQCTSTITKTAPPANNADNKKAPERGFFTTGGVRGIRTLDRAFDPILP